MKAAGISVRELPAPIPYLVLRGHGNAVNSIDFTGGDHGLVSGDVSGSVFQWNVKSQQIVKRWNAHTASVTTVQCINPMSLLTSGRDGLIKIWDSSTSANKSTFLSRCQHFCNASSNGGDLIVSGDESSKV